MKNWDWQNVFGRAPKDFLDQVDETINRLEEESEMKRRYKVSIVLVAAALIVLMAGAALAAGMGLIEGINQRGLITVPDSAQELIQSDLGSLSTDLFDMAVEAAMTDGKTVFAQVRLTPKNPEEYVLMSFEYTDPDEDSGAYIIDEDAREIDGTKGRLIGRVDGRKIIRYNVYATLPGVSLEQWDIENNADGSVSLWFRGGSMEEIKQRNLDRLTFECWWGVHGEFSGEDVPSSWNWVVKKWLPEKQSTTVSIENTAKKVNVRMEAAGESEKGMIKLLGGSIEFTPLHGYFEARYDVDEPEGSWLLLEFSDAEGNRINSLDGSWGEEYDRLSQSMGFKHTGAIQTFDPIPDTIYLEVFDLMQNKAVVDRIEVKLIPEE